MTEEQDKATFLRQMAEAAAQQAQDAESRLEEAAKDVEESRQRLMTWMGALRYYQEALGMPLTCDDHLAPDLRYASIGPTEIIDLWADEHEELVVVSDVTTAVIAGGGPYKTRRKARTTVEGTIRKNRRFKWVKPGTWRRTKLPEPRRDT